MLAELRVRDYALIDELAVEFGAGLNVITGETGAGKSLVIDCVGLAIGGRASAEMIRSGRETAVVEAVFEIPGLESVAETLVGCGIDPEPDGTLLVTREISRTGRNRCRVNGSAVTLSTLSAIGEQLVDIYGQHEHQSLARPGRHISLLDSFGGEDLSCLLAGFRELHSRWRAISSELSDLRSRAREREHRIDLLTFQASEIESARLSPDEDVQLQAEKTVLTNAERLYDAVNRAYALIYESAEGHSRAAQDSVGDAVTLLQSAAKMDPALSPLRDTLQAAYLQLAEAARALRAYRDSVDFSPARLEQVEERLALIARLKRKYGGTLSEVIEHGRAARAELERTAGVDRRASELEREIAAVEAAMGEAASALSSARARVARVLEERVCEQLTGLSMPNATFSVHLARRRGPGEILVEGEPCAPRADGVDEVEFLFSANRGEALGPLAKIASGGELSRVMLAIKSVLAVVDDMPTMVFDEIDQGVGGEASVAVAGRLKEIGRVRQVLVVTHLPQIAAVADHHLTVAKAESGGRTAVMARALSAEDRVAEVARMLGGDNPTPVTVAHAREMLRRFHPLFP
ncbi:MAG: DNA repair protein RecN [Firmicutes bacterium]|nr:DNA repair protein RecN [Bacillota bacterium]